MIGRGGMVISENVDQNQPNVGTNFLVLIKKEHKRKKELSRSYHILLKTNNFELKTNDSYVQPISGD